MRTSLDSARGVRRLRFPPVPGVNAADMPYALLPDEPLGDALPRIAAELAGNAIESLSIPEQESAVHEARKACKRLRALLRMFRPGIGSGYRAADTEVRDIARMLSGSRDQDVLPNTCEKLLAEQSSREARGAVESIRDVLLAAGEEEAPAPFDAVIERLQSLHETALHWRAKRPGRSAADGVRRVYREGRRRLRSCELGGPATPWHEWRKSVKHHGYHANFLKKLHPAADAYAKPWSRLGKLLGDEHDLSILEERLVETTLSEESLATLALRATRERRAVLRKKATKLGERLYQPSPRIVRKVVRELLS